MNAKSPGTGRDSETAATPSRLWWIVTTTDAAALKEGWKEIARKWARLWPDGRPM